MTKTINYNLNQWDADDPVRRTDFNEDNAKLDAALSAKADAAAVAAAQSQVQAQLAGKADTSALAALQTVVNGKGNCQVEYGTYVGTGGYGSDWSHPTVLRLGYRPRLVLVGAENDDGLGIFLWPAPWTANIHQANNSGLAVQWLEDGLQWQDTNGYTQRAGGQLNESGVTYYYVAFH